MIHYYHPNKAISGSACSFSYAADKDVLFVTILKQAKGIGEQGMFKDSMKDPLKRIDIKLSFIEAAGVIDTIETNRDFKAYHEKNNKVKSINFVPWKPNDVQKGFSFSITQKEGETTNSFYIGFSFPEAREIKEFLSYVLRKHFEFSLKNGTTNNFIPAEV